MASHPQQSEQTDIFSLSDQVLSDRLQFIEEIGFGNWGSVWLCRPKGNHSSPLDGLDKLQEAKIAVKLVHRSKTPTTAARVKSLWNEMKIVRTLKSNPHPSIILFHSFIITPSYALITMAYLPTLIPVEVDETKAREWFRSLLSGVEFLHKRGVVHNDIKPANILLSHQNVPVLVDFGFAEKYDRQSNKAFHSNLSYGTPEYLSPERARGLPHDTRKSDIWALGITFFEILVGRTPFEYSDGEQFSTKEDLEKYWSRTLRGKWVGSWKMSKAIEKMIRRMIAPNADLRCTASEAMIDSYWTYRKESSHRRSSSNSSSIVFETSLAKLAELVPPWKRPSNESLGAPPILSQDKALADSLGLRDTTTRSKSQLKAGVSKSQLQPKRHVPTRPPTDLSPVKASPPTSPISSTACTKENVVSINAIMSPIVKRPLGQKNGLNLAENLPPACLTTKPSLGTARSKPKGRVLMDLTGLTHNTENTHVKKDRVKERVREWEREKERLREMERMEERQREMDEELERQHERLMRQDKVEAAREQDKEIQNTSILTPASTFGIPNVSLPSVDIVPRGNEFAMNGIKQTLKMSIDKTIGLYKSSASGQAASTFSTDRFEDAASRSQSERESWEDEALIRDAKSSLPVVRHAIHNERVRADNREDRMTIWMRNIEKVVEDARYNFASSSAPLPPLPLAPLRSASHTNRSSRLPRRVLAANQIFLNEPENIQPSQTISSIASSAYATANNTTTLADSSSPKEFSLNAIQPMLQTPTRARRATVSTRSPEPGDTQAAFNVDTGSPSKRREKSRSHGNLLQHITPIAMLESTLEKGNIAEPSPRLSAVLDRSLFVATPTFAREDATAPVITITKEKSTEFDELTSSPLHVEPYPPRILTAQVPDTPSQRRLEGVYDRFLMATSGVKRLGRGYQSDNVGPVCSTPEPSVKNYKRNSRNFYSARRPMPPPVSSDDQRQATSADELGVMVYNTRSESPGLKDDSNTTVAMVRRAFKAIASGKTHVRRLSRTA